MSKEFRRIVTIGVIFCMLLSLCGCSINEREAPMLEEFDPSIFMQRDYFVIDNNSSLDELLTNEYNLEVLKDYFGDMSYLGNGELFKVQSIVVHTWSEVNSKFPVQCVRYHNNFHYSVYKVKEGGYYYVFWSVPVIGLQEEREIITQWVVYLNDLVSVSKFKSVVKNLSTAKDVLKVDPNVEFDWASSITRSYSLLNDGRVVEIDYSCDKLETLDDLVVTDIAIYKKGTVSSMLAAIDKNDLE